MAFAKPRATKYAVAGRGKWGSPPRHAPHEREADLGVVELLDVDALAGGGRHGRCLDDLHARRAHAMPRGHLLLARALPGQSPALAGPLLAGKTLA